MFINSLGALVDSSKISNPGISKSKSANAVESRYPYETATWGADDIPDILATLHKEDIKATFFIVGQWAEKFPDQVKAIAAGGHDIANHSYSHLRMGVLDRDRIRTEITQCSVRLNKITGNKIELFRAPYGDYTNDVINTAKSLGHIPIQWNVDSLTIV